METLITINFIILIFMAILVVQVSIALVLLKEIEENIQDVQKAVEGKR